MLAAEPLSDTEWFIAEEISAFPANDPACGGSMPFWVAKRWLDVMSALIALPVIAALGLVILILNPVFNPGTLLYRQKRMGLNGKPFTAIKFRSMTDVVEIDRGPYDDLESHRITILGRFMRRMRIDELPQFWNILWGDMSLIGPRPDYYPHAIVYCHDIPFYSQRHLVRPGITGLAQVRSGYASCPRSVAAKVSDDLDYIRDANWKLEAKVFAATVRVVLNGFGSR